MTSLNKLAKASALALLSLSAISASAQADASKMYGEIGYTPISYTEGIYKANPGILRALIGTEVHPNLNLEGMLGLGIVDGSTTISNIRVASHVDRVWGLYVRPKAMLTPDLELFGRVGYASSKLTLSLPGYGFSSTGSGGSLSYGAGLSFKVAPKTSLALDYMSYYNKNGAQATGFTVGVGYKF